MPPPYEQRVVDAFKEQLGSKYTLGEVIGAGSRGICYEAVEIASEVAVVVKISRDGLDVAGQRDFRVPRQLTPTPRVAATHAIEPFKVGKLTHYAVVSQRVYGVTLEAFVQGLARLPLDGATDSERDFALAALRDLAATLCDGVLGMHSQGFGHGDLHERNIMVSVSNPHGWPNLEATLIDLGNASLVPSRDSHETETKLIEKDVAALRRCLALLFQHVPTAPMYRTAILGAGPHVEDVRWVTELLTLVFGSGPLDGTTLTEDLFDDILRELLARQIGGSHGAVSFRRALEEAADTAGVRANLDNAVSHLLEQVQAGEVPKVEVSLETSRRSRIDVGGILRRLATPGGNAD